MNPLGGMFQEPEQKRTFGQRAMGAVRNFGAGLAGFGPEFIAMQRQEQQQLDEQRQKAMAKDAMTVYQLLNDNKIDDAISLVDRRVKYISELGGDPTDTLEIRQMLTTPGRLDEARQELGLFVQASMENGLLPAPRVPEQFTLGADEVRYDDQGRVIARGIPKPAEQQGPLTAAGKLRADLAAGKITQADFDAEMARMNQPTAEQRPPAPLTEIGRINRAVQTGEISQEQGDQMLNAAIQQQEIELATGQAEVDETANRDQMILSEMTRLYDLSNSLLANKSGLARSTGPVSARIPTLRQDAADFKADLEEFQNLLTMANLGRMTGVLSESDIRLIASASSGISETASEERMREKISAIQTRILPKLIEAGILSADGLAPMGDQDDEVELILRGAGL
jgi:hypothetical protein